MPLSCAVATSAPSGLHATLLHPEARLMFTLSDDGTRTAAPKRSQLGGISALTPSRLAARSFAPESLASVRSAPSRRANDRSADVKSALESRAPSRSDR